jgi:catechol 2,3-dioxygenase-like lactoylglutathione lyase family enzyme
VVSGNGWPLAVGDRPDTDRAEGRRDAWIRDERVARATCRGELVTQGQMIVPELYCSDFERSLMFYVRIAGFRVVYQRERERFAYLSRNGADLMIEQTVEVDRQLLAGEPIHPYGRGVNLQIIVDEIEDLYARFAAASSPIFRELEEHWYERNEEEVGVRQFVAMDPDGYLLRFAQFGRSRDS